MKMVWYLMAMLMLSVLGFGYWYAYTHAYLDMDLDDEQNKHILNAQLSFNDETGQLLAEGKTDNKAGIVLLRHPVRGYCEPSPEDHNARMRECLEEHSVWQAKWLPRLRAVTIRTGSCELKGVPVTFKIYSTWGFWWVPLPHIGGLESTRYRVILKINRSSCTTVG